MKRLLVLSLLAGSLLTPSLRTDGSAVTNEGHAVVMTNPTNGLPTSWSWASDIAEDDPRWNCSTMGNRICGTR